jgi:hypothetical protein
MTLRWGLVIGLFVHGAIVAAQATGVPRSWAFGDHKGAGLALSFLAGGLLIAAAASLALDSSTWRPLAVVGAAASCAYFLVYFQPLILIGLGIDIAMLVTIIGFGWPTPTRLGA